MNGPAFVAGCVGVWVGGCGGLTGEVGEAADAHDGPKCIPSAHTTTQHIMHRSVCLSPAVWVCLVWCGVVIVQSVSESVGLPTVPYGVAICLAEVESLLALLAII